MFPFRYRNRYNALVTTLGLVSIYISCISVATAAVAKGCNSHADCQSYPGCGQQTCNANSNDCASGYCRDSSWTQLNMGACWLTACSNPSSPFVRNYGSGYYDWEWQHLRDEANNAACYTWLSSGQARICWEICSIGKYSGNGFNSDAGACVDCVAGKYSNAAGSRSCNNCPWGTTSSAGASSCTPTNCPTGQFLNTAGNCEDCAVRYSSYGGRATSCFICPAGTFYSTKYCISCDSGKKQQNAGQTDCDSCPAGTYSSSRATTCYNCQSGKFRAFSTDGDCSVCPLGKYQDFTGRTQCRDCPVGMYHDDIYVTPNSLFYCKVCPEGKYNTNAGAIVCFFCPTNTYKSTASTAQCSACPGGKYISSGACTSTYQCDNSNDCVGCTSGSYMADGSSGESNCQECRGLTYFNSATQTCVECTIGVPNSRHSACTDGAFLLKCFYQPEEPATGTCDCSDAINGLGQSKGYGFLPRAQGECVACPAGYYANSVTSEADNTRIGGYTFCQECYKGTYSNLEDASDHCVDCAEGKYATSTGASACTLCAKGKYADSTTCELYREQSGRNDAGACRETDAVCQQCPWPLHSVPDRTRCQHCATGQQVSEDQDTCHQCEVGKFRACPDVSASAQCAEMCVLCDTHHIRPDAIALQTGCTACPIGESTTGLDRLQCHACDELDGHMSDLAYTAGEGCAYCPVGTFMNMTLVKQSSTPDSRTTRREACTPCTEGKYVHPDYLAATQCLPCPACPDQHYRTGCNKAFASHNQSYETGSNGTCVPCPPCEDPDEVRVDCLSRAGNNDANGTCVRRDWISRTAQCPVRSAVTDLESSVGLAGFSFQAIFGGGENSVDFACSRPCDGQAVFVDSGRAGYLEAEVDPTSPLRFNGSLERSNASEGFRGWLDTRYCTGPHACRTQSCSASRGANEEFAETYMQPWGCPMVVEAGDSNIEIQLKVQQQCQMCDSCGISNSEAARPPDFGRGCAVECTRTAGCDLEEIFDWTESSDLYKCKTCGDLRNVSLCSANAIQKEGLDNVDVSGNRPKLSFEGCRGRQRPATGAYDPDDPIQDPTYGECKRIADKACVSGHYDAGADGCLACLPHAGVPPLASKAGWGFAEDAPRAQTLFCQLDPCDEDRTGVEANGAICTRACAEATCAASDVALPCLLPHPTRCLRGYPAQRQDHSLVGNVPAHANLLETVSRDGTPQHYASFENLLLDTGADNDDLHQCVWNAIDIRDNDMNPAGVSFSFFPPRTAFGWLESKGSKFCNTWTRMSATSTAKPSPRYPLLPLQNAVTVRADTTGTRRVYTNTSARVALYWDDEQQRGYSGRGFAGDTAGVEVGSTALLERPAARAPSDLDAYLLLDMHGAPNATLAVLLPTDRSLATASWVPQWAISLYVREATEAVAVATRQLRPLRAHLKLGAHRIVLQHGFLQNSFDAATGLTWQVLHGVNASAATPELLADYAASFLAKPARFAAVNGSIYVKTTPLSPPAPHDMALAQHFPATHLANPQGGNGVVLENTVAAFAGHTGSLLAADVARDPRLLVALGSGLWHAGDDLQTLTPVLQVEYPVFVHSCARLRREPVLLAVATWHREQQSSEVQVRTLDGARDTDYVFNGDGLVLRLATHAQEGYLFSLMYREEVVTVQTMQSRDVFNSTASHLAPLVAATVCAGSTTADTIESSTGARDFILDPTGLILTSLLVARDANLLVVLPLMRIQADGSQRATLLVREFNASRTAALVETLHIEQNMPQLQAVLESQYAHFMSHAWLGSEADADILLGCREHLLRVRRATAHIELVAATEPASNLLGLADHMFVQLNHAFLRFHVSLPALSDVELSRSSCGVGFTDEVAELNTGQNTELSGTTLAYCRQSCIDRLSCLAFRYSGTCTLLTASSFAMQQTDIVQRVCYKQSQHVQAYSQEQGSALLPLFANVTMFGVAPDTVLVEGGASAVGFHAFGRNSRAAVQFERLASVSHADGMPIALTPLATGDSSVLWEQHQEGELVALRLFERAWTALGVEVDVTAASLVTDFDTIPTYSVLVLQAPCACYSATTAEGCAACATAETGTLLLQKLGSSLLFVNRTYSSNSISVPTSFHVWHGSSLLAVHSHQQELTPQLARNILQSFADNKESYAHTRTSTLPADSWLFMQRFLPQDAVSEALHIAAGEPVALMLHLQREQADSRLAERRFVAVDDVQVNVVLTQELTWHCTLDADAPRPALCTYLVVPWREQLAQLDLEVAMSEASSNAWQRLHVTVQLRAASPQQTGCRYRVFVRQVDENHHFMDTNKHRVRHIGCTLELGAQLGPPEALGECHVAIPVGMAEVNRFRLVGLSAVALDERQECQHPDKLSFQALILPHTQLHECEGDHYWSENEGRCHPCAEQREELGAQCELGHYVRGCAMLIDFANDVSSLCTPCPLRPTTPDTFYWTNSDSSCSFECVDGRFLVQLDSGAVDCSPCTQSLRFSCRMTPGLKWQACTPTSNETCVACDPGLLGRHEEFVAWDGAECNVRCKPGYYRSLPDRFCRPCTTDAAAVAPDPSGALAHTRLAQCSYFTDAARVPCSAAATAEDADQSTSTSTPTPTTTTTTPAPTTTTTPAPTTTTTPAPTTTTTPAPTTTTTPATTPLPTSTNTTPTTATTTYELSYDSNNHKYALNGELSPLLRIYREVPTIIKWPSSSHPVWITVEDLWQGPLYEQVQVDAELRQTNITLPAGPEPLHLYYYCNVHDGMGVNPFIILPSTTVGTSTGTTPAPTTTTTTPAPTTTTTTPVPTTTNTTPVPTTTTTTPAHTTCADGLYLVESTKLPSNYEVSTPAISNYPDGSYTVTTLAIAPGSNLLYVGRDNYHTAPNFFVIDTTTNSVVTSVQDFQCIWYPTGIAVSPVNPDISFVANKYSHNWGAAKIAKYDRSANQCDASWQDVSFCNDLEVRISITNDGQYLIVCCTRTCREYETATQNQTWSQSISHYRNHPRHVRGVTYTLDGRGVYFTTYEYDSTLSDVGVIYKVDISSDRSTSSISQWWDSGGTGLDGSMRTILFDPTHTFLYVSNSHFLMHFDLSDASFSLVAGSATVSQVDGVGLSAKFLILWSFAFSSSGQIWVGQNPYQTDSTAIRLITIENTGSWSCSTCGGCPAGEYRDGCAGSSAGNCLACDSATYKATTGSEACSACSGCPAGEYRDGCGGDSAGSCVVCANGKYKDNDGLGGCLTCTGCPADQHRDGCGGDSAGSCIA